MEPNQQPQPTPQKKLPSWLTTVTPLSKILAMILFITFPFVGFYLGMKYQERITVNTPSIPAIKITPTPIVTQVDISGWKIYTSQKHKIGRASCRERV